MPTPKKIDPKNLTPIQSGGPTKIDPSTLTPIGDENTDDRNFIQKGFDKLTAPESFGTPHPGLVHNAIADFTGEPYADPLITAASDLGAGFLGLASPLIHPINTVKSLAGLATNAVDLPSPTHPNDSMFSGPIRDNEVKTGKQLIQPFVKNPDESTGQYLNRQAGQGVSMIPQFATAKYAPEVGDVAASAVKPIVNTVGKVGKVATNPKVITPTIMAATAIANPHISSLLPMAGEMIGGTLFSKFGDTFSPASSMGPDFGLLNRMSKMGESTPEWVQQRPFDAASLSPLAESQQKAAINQYGNAKNNIIRKYSTTDTGVLKNKLDKLDNNYFNATTNDYNTLQNLQSIPKAIIPPYARMSPYFRLAPLDITNQDNTEE